MITTFSQVPDPDAAKYIAAVNGTGYSMSTAEKGAIITFISALKQNGLWKRAYDFAIYPLLGNTADSQKFNLLNPVDSDAAYRLTWYGSPTHNTLGVKGNGSSQYVDTHMLLSAFNNTNFSGAVWVQETISYSLFGNYDSGNVGYGLAPKYTDGLAHYAVVDKWNPYGTYERTFANADGSQLSLITRTDATAKHFYRNNILLDTDTYPSKVISTVSSNPPLYLLVGFKIPTIGASYSPNTVSFFSFLSGITATQVTTFYNAVHALMVALGRA